MLSGLNTSLVGWPKTRGITHSEVSRDTPTAQQLRNDQPEADNSTAGGSVRVRPRIRKPGAVTRARARDSPDRGGQRVAHSQTGSDIAGAPIGGASVVLPGDKGDVTAQTTELEALRAELETYRRALQQVGVSLDSLHGNSSK